MELFNSTSFKISEVITKNYSTSFYTASLFFPKEIRKAIFGIYGFVRFADEIVDTFHQYQKKELLEKFETDLKHALDNGISLNPVLHTFVLIVKNYNIDYHLINAFLQSMQKDLHITGYATTPDIDEYIYGSAEVVGLMCLRVFCNGNSKEYDKLQPYAKRLGAAFQKVNFIRDLNADIFELNRTYFPDITNNNFTDNVKYQIIEDIEKDFSEARKGIKIMPQSVRPAVYIAYLYYIKLLKKIKKTPADVILKKRIRVSDFMKFFILMKGLISCKLNIIK